MLLLSSVCILSKSKTMFHYIVCKLVNLIVIRYFCFDDYVSVNGYYSLLITSLTMTLFFY